nr:type IV secretory system conjugative DNA transfer family protein [Candidatus Gracilibacteria bacterium]
MNKLFYIIVAFLYTKNITFARLVGGSNTLNSAKSTPVETGGFFSSTYDFLYSIFSLLLSIAVIIIGFILIKKFIRLVFEIYYAKNLVYIKITLPRNDSKLDKEKETKKDFKEKIGIMSMFFKATHKLSEVGFKETITNRIFRHAKLSLELVYDKGEVYFYIVTFKNFLNLVTQHITSIYTDAEVKVINPKEEYIDLRESGYNLRCASLSKENDDVFPIKSFKYLEDDPINNFTNVFGGLGKDDKAVFQIVIKPVGSNWNKKAKKAAGLVSKGMYKKKKQFKYFDLLWNPIVALIQGPQDMIANQNNAPGASSGDAYKIFNQAETESQKIMGEAASQPAYKASIRVLVSSPNEDVSLDGTHAIIGAASIFTDEYNNSLDNPQVREDGLHFIFTPMIYFGYKYKLLGFFQNTSTFSTDEVSTMYHFPDINYNKSPLIKWLDYKKLSPPHNLKVPQVPTILEEKLANGETKLMQRTLGGFPIFKDASLMGWNEYRNKKTPIYFNKKDRGRHHYIIGKSGGGKSVFIDYMARQDIRNGDGVCVIDPHGDLVESILKYIPKERAKDVIVFDPSDDERPMGLNILDIISEDPEMRVREMDRAALDATEIFIKIFGDEIFGPRIQHYFRNGALTLMEDKEDGGTLIDVPRLFVDDAFMRYKTSKIKNPVVKSFWQHEYANTGDREKQEMIPYFSAKFGPFITNTTIRNIIGQTKSAFNLREIMDNQKILLVNLSKGKIGALNAQLLGLIFVSKVNMAAMSRANIPEEQRKDFFLYVDEFQNFATDTFGEILSEARKYRLALIMAHQFIAQIGGSGEKYKSTGKPAIKDAVFGNVGTIMSFKVGAEDAEYLEKEYAPALSQQDIIGIANYTTYCKLNIDNASSRPFDFKTIWDEKYKNDKASEIIKEYSRKKYGRKKKYVDLEIEARLGITSLDNDMANAPSSGEIASSEPLNNEIK